MAEAQVEGTRLLRGEEAGRMYPDLCLDLLSFLVPVPPLGQTLLELEMERQAIK